MNGPAWQAIVPELISRSQLMAAIALNSTEFNIARAVGPAIAGFIDFIMANLLASALPNLSAYN